MPGTSQRKPLYHMVPQSAWQALKSQGAPYFPGTYEQDGFIHLTMDPAALETVFNNFYASAREPWEWICLVIDPAKLISPVVFEPAAPVGNTLPPTGYTASANAPLFPHLYGTIDYCAVEAEVPLRRQGDGRFAGIDGVVAAAEPGAEL